MDKHTVTEYFLSKPFTSVSQPFGEGVDVFKVKDKMFATLSLGNGTEKDTNGKMAGHYCINLKCDPDEALALRDIFDAVIPGYHMNKKLWNTIILDGSIPQGEIERMIDNSYMLVVNKMTKKDRQSILIKL
ncbi:MmcQ/YjbR family DNA-binding protein [Pseudoalteromonas sp. MMG024]|uniref:MmcQ/YjbR family DNA-binding protein n=1 Tax=Pseudoalteromonas sp. MMG024 TaxID=2909980 RepID=UPI001F2E6329|nr:MmcQ/YjbR family DNA-binding protein [Pseudoalteromonas sp. MMG024]MCF6457780.1 MmcQ/YjbR family DNA-binding protein [Pseudoalteromonas sp. MMG024]